MQLERRIQWVRLGGVAFGALQVELTPAARLPDVSRTLTWGLLCVLAVSAVAGLALVRARPAVDDERARARLRRRTQVVGIVTAALDVVLLAGFIGAWDFEIGGGTWALIVLLPLEGAGRWGRRGAWACAAAMAVAFVAAYQAGSAQFGRVHRVDDYTFALGLLLLSTAFVGAHAHRMSQLLGAEQSTREERERALAEREQLDEVRGRITAAVSHEIRTPVTGMRGFAETMLERWEEFTVDELRTFTGVLHEQALRLERLVCDLLQLTEIERQVAVIEAEEVEAADLVRRLERRFGLDIAVAAGADLRFPADRVRLELLLQRLVDNACRHGQPPIELAFEVPNDGRVVRISVADFGPGVPDELEHAMFERFVHGDGSDGRGLGLTIAQAMTAAHGGTLWYERGRGRTTFVAELPLVDTGDDGAARDRVRDGSASSG